MSDLNVCVIGAGAAGLTAIKACVECNLNVTCYEGSSCIGGIWSTNVTKYTVTNSSKEHSAFSDFTPPREYPLFMNQTQVNWYLNEYAKHFNLIQWIKFNHRVMCIKQIVTPDDRRRWQVTVKTVDHTRDHSTHDTQYFDAVLLCTGNNDEPFMPEISGMRDTFTGEVVHSSKLYECDEGTINSGERVIVIGGGNSAGDAAVWASDKTNEPIVMLIKSLPWIIPRRGPSGKPFDEVLNCRSMRAKLSLIPSHFFTNYLSQLVVETIYFDHKLYCGGIKPAHGILDDQCMINDILPFKMITGNVKILQFKSIVAFGERSLDVILHDDRTVTRLPCDRVICATGFNNKLRKKQIVSQLLDDLNCKDETMNTYRSEDVNDEKVNYPLYKHMFIPEYGHTLAIIGSISPLGPVFPIVELQSRWACRLIATLGKGNKFIQPLPSVERMKSIITRDLAKQPQASSKANLVDWLHYMDDIASQISSCPSFLPLLVRDPLAWYYTYFGPCYSYQFRLNDHHCRLSRRNEGDDKSTSDAEENHCNWSLVKRDDVSCVTSIATEHVNSTARDHPDDGKDKNIWSRLIVNEKRNCVSRRALFTATNRIEDSFKYY